MSIRRRRRGAMAARHPGPCNQRAHARSRLSTNCRRFGEERQAGWGRGASGFPRRFDLSRASCPEWESNSVSEHPNLEHSKSVLDDSPSSDGFAQVRWIQRKRARKPRFVLTEQASEGVFGPMGWSGECARTSPDVPERARGRSARKGAHRAERPSPPRGMVDGV
jgi:hypothetical protein